MVCLLTSFDINATSAMKWVQHNSQHHFNMQAPRYCRFSLWAACGQVSVPIFFASPVQPEGQDMQSLVTVAGNSAKASESQKAKVCCMSQRFISKSGLLLSQGDQSRSVGLWELCQAMLPSHVISSNTTVYIYIFILYLSLVTSHRIQDRTKFDGDSASQQLSRK